MHFLPGQMLAEAEFFYAPQDRPGWQQQNPVVFEDFLLPAGHGIPGVPQEAGRYRFDIPRPVIVDDPDLVAYDLVPVGCFVPDRVRRFEDADVPPEQALTRPAHVRGHGFEDFPPDVEQRAWDLLTDHLDAEQRLRLKQVQYFHVEGSRGTVYRIRVAPTFNVDELDEEGHTVATLCVVPVEAIPKGDRLLAQALLLEADEEQFWRIANKGQHGWQIPPWPREPGAETTLVDLNRANQQLAEDWRALAVDQINAVNRANEAALQVMQDLAQIEDQGTADAFARMFEGAGFLRAQPGD